MSEELDFILKGGRLYDGAGNPWNGADIGIKGRKIKASRLRF
jgi:N-acyl-D-aspartate/D-glutamate deacylase